MQKNTLILCTSRSGRFCTTRLMLRRATYWISLCGLWDSVTSGGDSFRQKRLTVSLLEMISR